MNKTMLISLIYNALLSLMEDGSLPVDLSSYSVVGTVQDDPFDRWITSALRLKLPDTMEIFHAGNLTTPDLVIRERQSKISIGIEVKKLIQQKTGADPRGLTMDYNSCLPCGSTLIKVGRNTEIIPCYYLNALLNPDSTKIVSLVILDGDFLNYDLSLHKEAKLLNTSLYNHGPYGEGSVRIRRMYTYPNPLNSKIDDFFMHYVLVIKKQDFYSDIGNLIKYIVRTDIYDNNYIYCIIDNSICDRKCGDILTINNIFDMCKKRNTKIRTPAMVEIPPLEG